MTATPTPSAKALALESIDRAIELAQKGASPRVLVALMQDARERTEQIDELKRPRKPKAAKVTA